MAGKQPAPKRTRTPRPTKPVLDTAPGLVAGVAPGRLRAALEVALTESGHLVTGDAAAVELARCLADKIDVWDKIVCYAVEDADQMEKARPVVPTHDNVTPATFLKSLESLGLTVSARGGLVKGGGDSAVFQVPADSALDASTV